MDRELLDALSNLSLALEKISESLSKEKSESKTDVGSALQSGDFGKQLIEINEGIKSLKDDTKKILDNQETILKLQKEQSGGKESQLFEGAGKGKTKEMIISGVAVIALIAGAVLAIGLAFKLIGEVDFLSVIALSFSLVLMSEAFSKIASIENLTLDKVLVTGVALVTMSVALMLSSKILTNVVPVSLLQLVTVVFIAAAFGAAALGLGALIFGLSQVGLTESVSAAFILPIVLVATSLAIAASSVILQAVVPVGIFQMLTVVLIGLAFGVLSYGLGQLIQGFKGIDPATALIASYTIPIVLIALSLAILAASVYFQAIMPIGIFQALTAILISATFVVLAYAVKPLLSGVKDVKEEDILKGTIVIIALTAAVVIASYILTAMPSLSISSIFNFFLASLAISASVAVLALAVKLVNKLGNVDDYIEGGLSIVIISTTIMLSSLILSLGSYQIYPKVEWILSSGLSITGFAIVNSLVVKLGTLGDYIKGGLSIVVISTTIMLSSLILSVGSYEEYPGLSWALGVSLSLVAFGIGALLLGTQALNPFFYAGLGLIILVSGTILATSLILNEGSYDSYPSVGWSLGVALSLSGFGIGALILGTQALNPFFYAGLGLMLTVALTIVLISKVFEQGTYEVYPPSSWVIPTSLVIGSFAIMASLLALSLPLLVPGIVAIGLIVGAIYLIDRVFSTGKFNTFPNKAWQTGVNDTLESFSVIISNIRKKISFADLALGGLKMLGLAKVIKSIDDSFSEGKYEIYPNKEWVDGSFHALKTMGDLVSEQSFFGAIAEAIGDLFGVGGKSTVIKLAEGIVSIDKVFATGTFQNYPTREYIDGTIYAIQKFKDIVSMLESDDTLSKGVGSNESLKTSLSNIMLLAVAFDRLGTSMGNFSKSLQTLDLERLQMVKGLTSNVILLSLMDPDMFESMMDKLEERGGVFADLIKDFEEKKSSSPSLSPSAAGSVTTGAPKSNDLGVKLDRMTAILADISGVVGTGGDLRRYLLENTSKESNISPSGKIGSR